MNKIIYMLLTCILFLHSPFHVYAEESDRESPEHIAVRLQQHYDEIKSLTFTFHQETSGELTGKARNGSGRAVFFRDGKSNRMRWDYTEPDEQVLLSDGKEFFMYFAKLQQMVISPAENLDSDLTYSFFAGRGNLVEDFQILPAEDNFSSTQENAIQSIKIIPRKQQSQVQDIHLWVTSDSILRRISIRDHFGTITVLNFSNINFDGLSGKSPEEIAEIFSFTPPENTEIIYQ